MSSNRIIVWDEPEYIASMHEEDLGEGRKMTLFHLDVFYFSAEILRLMLNQWAVFRRSVPIVLFAHGEVDDDKFARFISYFGFEYLRDIPCSDGKTRRLFVNYAPSVEANK